MEHLNAFDDPLVQDFRREPSTYIKTFEEAVATIYRNDYYDESNPDMDPAPKFQVQIHSDENPVMIRDLQSDLVGKLICIPGIVTSTSKTAIRATKAVYSCRVCGNNQTKNVNFGLVGVQAPYICDNCAKGQGPEQGLNTYSLNTDLSEFADQQILKLQEAPELIPTGEMPRNVLMTCDRELTDKCTPGNRVKIVGILSITKRQN